MAITLEYGDYIESNFAEFIRQNISNYEELWGKFIGNDGNAKMIEVYNLPKEKQKDRLKFSEHLYTCLESLVCMDSICKDEYKVDLTYPIEYVKMLNAFLAFQAHAGRIKDNIERLLPIYFSDGKSSELLDRLKDTYNQRNNVIHGKKIPCHIEDALVLIAPPEGQELNSRKWNDKMFWSDINQDDLIFLTDYLKESLFDICKIVNDILANLLEPINSLIKKYGINLSLPENYPVNNISASGNTSIGISGFNGSSGFGGRDFTVYKGDLK
jgi:hypothetical protein